MIGRPGFYPPGYYPVAPDRAGSVAIPFVAPGFFPPGFWPPGFNDLVGPAAPLAFTTEMSAWLEPLVGVPVTPCHLPRRGTNYPLLSFTVVDKDTPSNLSGSAGATWIHLQFDAWGPDYHLTELLQTRLFTALAGYRGPMGAAFCQGATAGRSLSDYTPDIQGADHGMYRSMREYSLWHTDPAPIR